MHKGIVFAAVFLSIASLGGSFSSCVRKKPEPVVLQLGIWSNYLHPDVLSEFEKRTGMQVRVTNYSSNEELLAKIQAGASGYDVIVPSDYMVTVMSKLGLIRKLDHSKLPNLKALDPARLNLPFDPGNAYSVPYDSGTTGIAVNRELYGGKISGWKDLFSQPELAGKFSLLDDPREAIGAALKSLGFSLNTVDSRQLAQAGELLKKNRSRVKAFTSETLDGLAAGELPVAHTFVMDALQARKRTSGKVEYILPAEGGTYWVDNFCVPSTAAHSEGAHQLINFLLEGKVGALTAQGIFVNPASKEAMGLLPKSFIQENPVLFPSPDMLRKFEMIQDLGEASTLWDRTWTEVKAGG